MTPIQIIAQSLGAVALIIGFIMYVFKSRGLILIFKGISDLLWASNYLLSEMYVACIVSVICVARSIVFFFRDKRTDKQNTAWLIVFLILVFFSPCYDIFVMKKEAYVLLPAIGSIIAVFAFYQKKASMVRLLGVISSVPWLIYTIVYFNLTATLNSAIQITVGTIMAIIFFVKEKKEKAPELSPPTNESFVADQSSPNENITKEINN